MDKQEYLKLIAANQTLATSIAGKVHLSWRIAAQEESSLLIEYTLENQHSESILVLDHILQFSGEGDFATATEAAIQLLDPNQTSRLNLLKGYIHPPFSEVATEVIPAARILATGESLVGTIRINIPIYQWHPNEGRIALQKKPTTLILKIGIMPNFCHLTTIVLHDKSNSQVPKSSEAHLYQQWISGDEIALDT